MIVFFQMYYCFSTKDAKQNPKAGSKKPDLKHEKQNSNPNEEKTNKQEQSYQTKNKTQGIGERSF